MRSLQAVNIGTAMPGKARTSSAHCMLVLGGLSLLDLILCAASKCCSFWCLPACVRVPRDTDPGNEFDRELIKLMPQRAIPLRSIPPETSRSTSSVAAVARCLRKGRRRAVLK